MSDTLRNALAVERAALAAMAERSVAIRAAYAFREWPPRAHRQRAGLAAMVELAERDPLWARYLDGDR